MRFSKEEEYLRQKDRKLKKIIDTNGHIVFKPNKKNLEHSKIDIAKIKDEKNKKQNDFVIKLNRSLSCKLNHEDRPCITRKDNSPESSRKGYSRRSDKLVLQYD